MKGGRVKNSERMREREQDKAEAKFAVELRQTKRELVNAEHEHNRKEKESKERMNRHEMESRKTEKDLSVRHKRQLEEMRGDLDRRREVENQARDEFDRQGRQKTRQVQRHLEETHTELSDVMAEKERLLKTVRKGAATLEAVQKEGLGWQGKFTDQQDKMKDREELVTCLERSVVEKQRQIALLQRKSEDLAHKLLKRDEEISTHVLLARKVCLSFFPLLFLSSYLLFSLLFETNR